MREQNYDERPSPSQVALVCRGLARSVFGAPGLALRPGVALSVIAARARGALTDDRSRLAFGRVALANAASRRWLAGHMERVVFHAGGPSALPPAFDAFGLTQIPLTRDNIEDALLASGSIPLVCEPVRDVPAAPPGDEITGSITPAAQPRIVPTSAEVDPEDAAPQPKPVIKKKNPAKAKVAVTRKRVVVTRRTDACGSYKAVWYTNKDGRRKYRCVKSG